MVDADGAPISSGTKPKYVAAQYVPPPDEIERITIPPSTELIPDEYEHNDNRKGLVVIFSSRMDSGNKEVLQKALADQNYDVSKDNMYEVSTKDTVLATLKEISTTNHKDKTCLIVIFMANAEMEDQFLPDREIENSSKCISVREVWSHFIWDNCPSFRRKPKIFLFQAFKRSNTTETDSVMIAPPEGAYDIPAEADMLIVYKRVEYPDFRNSFMEQLCNNFDRYGLREDIVALITHTFHADNVRPLVISTLTKKFYITPSNKRGHYYELHKNHDEALLLLDSLKNADKSKIEYKVVKKWQEVASGSNVSNVDASSSKAASPSKAESSQSKRVSRTTSTASSVDSKKRPRKTAVKEKPDWKY